MIEIKKGMAECLERINPKEAIQQAISHLSGILEQVNQEADRQKKKKIQAFNAITVCQPRGKLYKAGRAKRAGYIPPSDLSKSKLPITQELIAQVRSRNSGRQLTDDQIVIALLKSGKYFETSIIEGIII